MPITRETYLYSNETFCIEVSDLMYISFESESLHSDKIGRFCCICTRDLLL